MHRSPNVGTARYCWTERDRSSRLLFVRWPFGLFDCVSRVLCSCWAGRFRDCAKKAAARMMMMMIPGLNPMSMSTWASSEWTTEIPTGTCLHKASQTSTVGVGAVSVGVCPIQESRTRDSHPKSKSDPSSRNPLVVSAPEHRPLLLESSDGGPRWNRYPNRYQQQE